MPQNDSEITLRLNADTKEAVQKVDALGKRVETLGNGLQKRLAAQAAMGAANASVAVLERLAVAADLKVLENKFVATTRGAVATGAQLAAAFAPIAPPFGAVIGASVGAVAGALEKLGLAARQSKDELAALAAEQRRGDQRARDSLGSWEWQWQNADEAGRGKMQAEARERLKRYSFAIERGMTVQSADVLDAARFDPALAKRMMYAVEEREGTLPAELSRLEEGFRLRSREDDVERTGRDVQATIAEVGSREKNERGLAAALRAGRGRGADIARANLDALDKAEGEHGRAVARFAELREAVKVLGPTITTALRTGRGAFDPAYDRAYLASLAAPEQSASPSPAASLPAFSPSAAPDSYSAMGIGFTGADPAKKETIDLLRRIADATTRTADKPRDVATLSV